jgi:hypothetical protein
VEEGPVAEVLEQVRHVGERRHADPLRALATHVGHAGGPALGHRERHAVAADAGGGHRALGHEGRAVVRAPRAEVRLARQRQRRRALAQRLQQGHPSRDRAELQLALEPAGDDLRDAVGVQLPAGGHQRTPLLVALAHHARVHGVVVERVAHEHLHERALLLDDEDLLEPAREVPHDARLHREQHPDLEDADAMVAQFGVVESQLAERLAQVVVGLAGRGEAEPGVGGVEDDTVEPVGGGERLGRLEPAVGDLALQLQPVGRQQCRVLGVPPRLALVLEARIDDRHPVGRDLGRADLVGDVGHDLEAHPETGVARQLEAETAEIQDLLDVAGEEHGELRVVEGDLRVRRQGRGLRQRIVAPEREHPAVAPDSGEVGVLEDVTGPVDAGALAVPDAEHAVVLGLREVVGELAAVDGGGAQVLVQPRDEHDVVLAEQRLVALQREIEAAQRRAAVARDQGGGAEAAAAIGAVLVERQSHQRLDARQEDDAVLLPVLCLEREIVRDRHGPSGRNSSDLDV